MRTESEQLKLRQFSFNSNIYVACFWHSPFIGRKRFMDDHWKQFLNGWASVKSDENFRSDIFNLNLITMKILQTALRNFSTLGINSQQAFENRPLNIHSVLACLVLSSSTVSCAMYFFRLANTFIEYTYSIFGFSSLLQQFFWSLHRKCGNSLTFSINWKMWSMNVSHPVTKTAI